MVRCAISSNLVSKKVLEIISRQDLILELHVLNRKVVDFGDLSILFYVLLQNIQPFWAYLQKYPKNRDDRFDLKFLKLISHQESILELHVLNRKVANFGDLDTLCYVLLQNIKPFSDYLQNYPKN